MKIFNEVKEYTDNVVFVKVNCQMESFALYNTEEEVETLIRTVSDIVSLAL
jgi:selenocysteine lyase/cysteine desulfurase